MNRVEIFVECLTDPAAGPYLIGTVAFMVGAFTGHMMLSVFGIACLALSGWVVLYSL